MNIIKWIRGILPVRRSAMDKILAKASEEQYRAILALRQRHKRELVEERQRVEKHIDRLSRINWRERPYGTYAIELTFDPRAFGGGVCHRDDLAFMAKCMAHKVEMEIATARFISAAHETER